MWYVCVCGTCACVVGVYVVGVCVVGVCSRCVYRCVCGCLAFQTEQLAQGQSSNDSEVRETRRS